MSVIMFETEQQEAGGWRDLGIVEEKKGDQYSSRTVVNEGQCGMQ